eukprot:TRINITY_DN93856_c0_g1_i1.p1 TRINITY_DN93856_c0_g1~~TRINITY_DN93856_c0_g1_i1.p1  ORF type:complete len:652 (-),score=138.66 TRINITY_DN93856_c0_g1_i1:42-1997(-)
MHYDPDGPLRSATTTRPPFHIDFVVGGNAEAGSIARPEALPLSHLYFCDSCSQVVSRRDLAEDVDSYYCPHCLENMPSSEAMLCGMRCSKCWECPVCSSTLTPCVANSTSKEQTYHYACSYCRWSSRGRHEAALPEQLLSQIVSLERDGEPRQRMAAIFEAFRVRAQEHQREKELHQRLQRRSAIRGSFSSSSLGAFAAGGRFSRFSSTVAMRSGARLSLSGSVLAGGNHDELGKKPSTGPWRAEDIEAKLAQQAAGSKNLRWEARAAAHFAASGSTSDAGLARESPSKRLSLSGQAVPEVPVLEGLSVQELLQAHREALTTPDGGSTTSMLEELQRSIDSTDSLRSESASLQMRLVQVSYGYQGTTLGWTQPEGELRRGHCQLESPLHHMHAWKLLPVRKALLTKRSRRCRLLLPAEPGDTSERKPCKGLVVKPQLKPTASEAFKKNSVAMSFVPRCVPWSWVAGGQTAGGEPEETAELIFVMVNPLDSDVEISLEPQAFNADSRHTLLQTTYKGSHWEAVLSEQNVEVLTAAFTTTLAKFCDLGEAEELWDEEEKRSKQFQEKDDRQVLPDRKLNKVLIRLRFRRAKTDKDSSDVKWTFFVGLKQKFTDSSSKQHAVDTILRFGLSAAQSTARSTQGFQFTPPRRSPAQ